MSWERASAFETTQIGVEVTPGVVVPALKRLQCTSIRFAPSLPVTPYTPEGSLAPTTQTRGKESTAGDYDGRLCYNDIVYFLSSVLCKPSIALVGGSAGVYRWTFKPQNWRPNDVQSYSIERGSPYYAERAINALFNAWTMRYNQTEVTNNGNIIAQEPDFAALLSTSEIQVINLGGGTGGTFTVAFMGSPASPTQAFNVTATALQAALEALPTIGPGNVAVAVTAPGVYQVTFKNALGAQNVPSIVADFALLTGATAPAVTTATAGASATDIPAMPVDVGATSVWLGSSVGSLARIRRVQEGDLTIAGRRGMQYTADDQEPSWSASVEKRPDTLMYTMTMQRDADFKALIAHLRASETWFHRTLFTGPALEVGFPARIQITFPFGTSDPRFGSAQDVETGQLGLFPKYESGFGSFMEIVVDNTLSAL